jgi:hypothetical protein
MLVPDDPDHKRDGDEDEDDGQQHQCAPLVRSASQDVTHGTTARMA